MKKHILILLTITLIVSWMFFFIYFNSKNSLETDQTHTKLLQESHVSTPCLVQNNRSVNDIDLNKPVEKETVSATSINLHYLSMAIEAVKDYNGYSHPKNAKNDFRDASDYYFVRLFLSDVSSSDEFPISNGFYDVLINKKNGKCHVFSSNVQKKKSNEEISRNTALSESWNYQTDGVNNKYLQIAKQAMKVYQVSETLPYSYRETKDSYIIRVFSGKKEIDDVRTKKNLDAYLFDVFIEKATGKYAAIGPAN